MLTSSKISKGINGIANIPGDKSISHRSVIIPSIANGTTEVNNILKSEDVIKTINILKLMGVNIEEKNNNFFSCFISSYSSLAGNQYFRKQSRAFFILAGNGRKP